MTTDTTHMDMKALNGLCDLYEETRRHCDDAEAILKARQKDLQAV